MGTETPVACTRRRQLPIALHEYVSSGVAGSKSAGNTESGGGGSGNGRSGGGNGSGGSNERTNGSDGSNGGGGGVIGGGGGVSGGGGGNGVSGGGGGVFKRVDYEMQTDASERIAIDQVSAVSTKEAGVG